MMPVTLQMHVDHVDHQAFADYQNQRAQGRDGYRFLDEIQDWMKNGEWPFIYNRLITVQLTEKDTFMVNTSRMIGCDGTDAASVSAAMAQGRRESLQLLAVLRKHIPGFADARLKAIASTLGVRETRRIVGDFTLTMQDLAAEGEPEDVIGYVCGTWDVPDPYKPSVNPLDRGEKAGITKEILPIPYRVMIPRPATNLICPGRAVSVERPILGPYRDQAPCMAMGQAAGTAAVLALESGCAFGEVDVAALRKTLAENDCIVDARAIPDNPV
jgi:hypothetical protein